MGNKIILQFRRSTRNILTAWEIGKIVDNYGSYFYKYILLDELKSILNNGINPKDIFILDKSFRLGTSYINLHNDGRNKNIINLYTTMGLPYSIRPNKSIVIMKELFSCYRDFNEIKKSSNILGESINLNTFARIVDILLKNEAKDYKETINYIADNFKMRVSINFS